MPQTGDNPPLGPVQGTWARGRSTPRAQTRRASRALASCGRAYAGSDVTAATATHPSAIQPSRECLTSRADALATDHHDGPSSSETSEGGCALLAEACGPGTCADDCRALVASCFSSAPSRLRRLPERRVAFRSCLVPCASCAVESQVWDGRQPPNGAGAHEGEGGAPRKRFQPVRGAPRIARLASRFDEGGSDAVV